MLKPRGLYWHEALLCPHGGCEARKQMWKHLLEALERKDEETKCEIEAELCEAVAYKLQSAGLPEMRCTARPSATVRYTE